MMFGRMACGRPPGVMCFFRGELRDAFQNPEVVWPNGLSSLGKSPAADGFRHIVLQCSFDASM